MMKIYSEFREKGSLYSAPLCVVMLLLAGLIVKFGAALQLMHQAHN